LPVQARGICQFHPATGAGFITAFDPAAGGFFVARQGERKRDAAADREDRDGDRLRMGAGEVKEEAAQPAAERHAGAGAHHLEGIFRLVVAE
jgi:hypothetical protein